MSKSFSISVPTTGHIQGRNGTFNLTAVEAWAGENQVQLNGIGQRGFVINGGIYITHDAMDELATKWLQERLRRKAAQKAIKKAVRKECPQHGSVRSLGCKGCGTVLK